MAKVTPMLCFERASIRLLFDLQACQTPASANRGVGRATHGLFDALSKAAQPLDIWAVTSPTLPYSPALDGFPESRIKRLPLLPEWPSTHSFLGGERDSLDALAYSSAIAPLNADIIHIPHVFEGFMDRAVLPAPSLRSSGQILSATIHDLIPLIFHDRYLQDPAFRKWYLHRVSWLKHADLLFAVSESSRQDAINLLGIEPWRIVTIYGGVSTHFGPPTKAGISQGFRARYGLADRFALYTAGDDFRKNIEGAIHGFARVPLHVRRGCQLVIVCSIEPHRKAFYLKIARDTGLTDRDVVITGFVPETDLPLFYQACDVFFFPSLYEGFGLPLLEAMACGAPVVGGNNSSIAELISRQDALFDSTSCDSIAEAISRVLADTDFSVDLRQYGIERSRYFSWTRTVDRAIQAFSDAFDRANVAGVHSAVRGWLPRKRLAVLSPLPPCRSGIADYNATFLPYLARYFDIDLYVDGYTVTDETLTTLFRIFDVSTFESVASNYDAVLYEFGNSEFHLHMLPLLEKFPGVVGLHDAYLSGMFGYYDFALGNVGTYVREMLAAHGPRARRYFAPTEAHPDPNFAAVVALPCTKRVLDAAIGVISHSPFNLALARHNYPEGWSAPYRIIPQMVRIAPAISGKERDDARRELGFSPDDFLVATFGQIAWTKWGDRLLEGFLSSNLFQAPNSHLIFAGELANDDFGRRLRAAVSASGIVSRLHITGFLSSADYVKYLRIVDVAVQLRTASRGGTPKGALDCLAFGVPVVLNNDASYRDYPDTVVYKVPAVPTVSDVASALNVMSSPNGIRRRALADAGRQYVRDRHDPARCAAAYAAAILEFTKRSCNFNLNHAATAFAPHLARTNLVDAASQAAAEWLSKIKRPHFSRRRLLIDVSHIARADHGTGIPRVVRELVHSFYCTQRAGVEPIAFELKDGALRVALPWLHSRGLLHPHEQLLKQEPPPIAFQEGDILLMLDSSWARYCEFFPIFSAARAAGVPVYTVIYDLLPITLPPNDVVPGGKEWFEGWVRDAIRESAGILCISESSAREVAAYIKTLPAVDHSPTVRFWHLGGNFTSDAAIGQPSEDVALVSSKPYLLMVGTIEPRKCHAIALETMEHLWKRDHSLCLCIAGKEGWMVTDFMHKLRGHPMLGKKLFFLANPSDRDIAALYEHAAGLLFLSKGEGFGLPLVEAANHHTPILCSDLPVFHEIAGRFATYTPTLDPLFLERDIANWWDARTTGILPDTGDMPRLTWEQSSSQLLDVLLGSAPHRA